MANKVKGIPEGASVVIPRLVCRDPAGLIEFCEHVRCGRARPPARSGWKGGACVDDDRPRYGDDRERTADFEETTEQERKDRWSDIQTKDRPLLTTNTLE